MDEQRETQIPVWAGTNVAVGIVAAMAVAMAFVGPAVYLAIHCGAMPAPNYWRSVLLSLIAAPVAFAAGAFWSLATHRWRWWGVAMAVLVVTPAPVVLTHFLPWAWATKGLGLPRFRAEDMGGPVEILSLIWGSCFVDELYRAQKGAKQAEDSSAGKNDHG